MAIVTDGVIKVWYGIVCGDREYLIFRRSTLTIEQHASGLLLGDVLALIEERHEHWSE
jgi:hypothetical protein